MLRVHVLGLQRRLSQVHSYLSRSGCVRRWSASAGWKESGPSLVVVVVVGLGLEMGVDHSIGHGCVGTWWCDVVLMTERVGR